MAVASAACRVRRCRRWARPGRRLPPTPMASVGRLLLQPAGWPSKNEEALTPREKERAPTNLYTKVGCEVETTVLPANRDAIAPDGSDVRILLRVAGGGLAHFEIGSGQTSVAVEHRTMEEIWFFVGGRGEMWRRDQDGEKVVEVRADVCVAIPAETSFQFRSFGHMPLSAIGVTIPPWPGQGHGEVTVVRGPWEPTVGQGPLP
jgi:mannose-6-phosphate isomerase-like protein (cupin superfamily)